MQVIPLEQQHGAVSQHPFWQLALALGAEPSHDITPRTTHLVAVSFYTSKVNRAMEAGLAVVRPSWLRHCSWRCGSPSHESLVACR